MTDERAARAIDKKLGQRVRARRLELGMSQERLAALLGVTFQQVQKYERGVNRIAASRLFEMSIALEMPISEFFAGIKGGEQKSSPRAELSSELSVPGAYELVRLYAGLRSAKMRRCVLDLVRIMDEGDS